MLQISNLILFPSGINFTDIVKTTGDQTITGATTFDADILLESLDVNGTVTVEEMLHSLTFNQIENDTLLNIGELIYNRIVMLGGMNPGPHGRTEIYLY